MPSSATLSPTAESAALPLGDGKIAPAPQVGSVVACPAGPPRAGGAFRPGEWIRDGLWYPDEKPTVAGAVVWPNAAISIQIEDNRRIIRANNLPQHPTGEFPIRPGTRAYAHDHNPNRIRAQSVVLTLPAQPEIAPVAGCVPLGMVGFTLTGAAIFNAFDLQYRDAPAYEIQDACNGHPEMTGQYHYHDWSNCLNDPQGDAGGHSSLIGFMLDGFPIYGLKGDGGVVLRDRDLDACHGHVGEVTLDGKRVTTYHYHFTREYPYTIGCFRGTVDSSLRISAP